MRSFIIIIYCLAMATTVFAQEGFVNVNENLKLHYNVAGSGTDTLVVPDGGWQLPYYKKYGKGLTFIIYDSRNRGHSGNSDEMGINYDVDDLEAVRRHFKIKKMNAIGWSYLGGMVALYASKYPENIKSIIQVGPMPYKRAPHFDPYVKSTQERRSASLDADLANMRSASTDKSDAKSLCRKFYEASIYSIIADENKAKDIASNVPCHCANEQPQNINKILGKIFSSLQNWDWTNQLATLNASMLIIHGVDDNIPVDSSKEWAALNPNSRLVIFKSSGHMPFAEEPELFFKTVKEFASK